MKSINLENIKDNLREIIKHPLFISISALIVILLVIIGIFTLIPKEEEQNVEMKERYWGNPDAKVVIEYYSDLECPACKEFWFSTEKALKEKYFQDIKFIYKHFPLTSIHAKADDAAEAAEAAGEQGKFFEFVDKLYEKQTPTEVRTWNLDKFVEYAKEVGVKDLEKFKQELKTKKYRNLIREYKKLGEEKGINATPTIFINGEKIENFSLQNIENKIQEILAQQKE